MSDNTSRQATWDPQWVMEDARALRRVVEALHSQGAQSAEADPLLFQGKFWEAPILLSLALEVALKAWQRRDRQGTPDRGHDLLELFEGLTPATQKRLEAKMPARGGRLGGEPPGERLRALLSSHRTAFIKWRDSYEGEEAGALFKTFDLVAVQQALTVLINAYYERGERPARG